MASDRGCDPDDRDPERYPLEKLHTHTIPLEEDRTGAADSCRRGGRRGAYTHHDPADGGINGREEILGDLPDLNLIRTAVDLGSTFASRQSCSAGLAAM